MLICVLLLLALALSAPLLYRCMGRGSSWVHAAVVAGVCVGTEPGIFRPRSLRNPVRFRLAAEANRIA